MPLLSEVSHQTHASSNASVHLHPLSCLINHIEKIFYVLQNYEFFKILQNYYSTVGVGVQDIGDTQNKTV